AELKRDWDITKMAVGPLAVGVALSLFAVLEFAIALGLGIYAAASPVPDPARIPMWGCFALAGLGFLVLGGILVIIATVTLRSFHPLPDETVRAFEKNLQAFVSGSNSRTVHNAPR